MKISLSALVAISPDNINSFCSLVKRSRQEICQYAFGVYVANSQLHNSIQELPQQEQDSPYWTNSKQKVQEEMELARSVMELYRVVEPVQENYTRAEMKRRLVNSLGPRISIR
jgi:hypothetical protein